MMFLQCNLSQNPLVFLRHRTHVSKKLSKLKEKTIGWEKTIGSENLKISPTYRIKKNYRSRTQKKNTAV